MNNQIYEENVDIPDVFFLYLSTVILALHCKGQNDSHYRASVITVLPSNHCLSILTSEKNEFHIIAWIYKGLVG